MLLVEPSKRPSYITVSFPPSLSDRSEKNEWCKKILEMNSNICCNKTNDNYIILGEYTKVRSLDREEPTETRCHMVSQQSADDIDFSNIPYSMFVKIFRRPKKEYPFIKIGFEPTPIIIYHNAYIYDTPAANWLAFNPMLAENFKWRLSENGFFQWIDSEGHIMVQSIWWNDNIIHQSSLQFNNIVGEGWLVVASKKGWKRLTSEFSNQKRIKYIERTYRDDSQINKCDKHFEEKI